MKKYLVLCAGFCAVLAMTSCGSSKESAYKKAYEKAKAQEQTQTEEPAQTETAVFLHLSISSEGNPQVQGAQQGHPQAAREGNIPDE